MQDQQAIPTLFDVDVLVIGGGSAGCSAAIAAGRQGASVALVERFGFLGGVSTGVLDTFYGFYTPGSEARRVVAGVPGDIVQQLVASGAAFERPNTYGAGTGITYLPDPLKRVYEELALAAGVRILLHTFCWDVLREGDRLVGVVTMGKSGPQQLRARQIVDCSGDADVAALAGAPFERAGVDSPVQTATTTFRVGNVDPAQASAVTRQQLHALMRTAHESGLDLPRLDGSIHRTPIPGVMFAIMTRVFDVDATDPLDLTRAEIEGRRQVDRYVEFLKQYVPGYAGAQLISTSAQIGIRESRRIRGDYWLTRADVLGAVRHPDDIALGGAPIEIHGAGAGTEWGYLADGEVYGIPFGCLLPQKVEGLLVAGKCLSASHDAHASARNMAQCMAMGQAAGTAAAMAAAAGVQPRDLDRAELQRQLRSAGALLDGPVSAGLA